MRYVVLDTDVASRVIKRQLGDPLAARLTGATWCVTFVTVGELWQWATMRSWGPRTREDLGHWLGRVVVLNSDDTTSRTWGRISAAARRRARPDRCRSGGEVPDLASQDRCTSGAHPAASAARISVHPDIAQDLDTAEAHTVAADAWAYLSRLCREADAADTEDAGR